MQIIESDIWDFNWDMLFLLQIVKLLKLIG